ncbi:MAG TPA: S24/S26 family peptidase [Calidithermus sp.]|nr:S24/S26 family peptidase [Calidithermus sp.]
MAIATPERAGAAAALLPDVLARLGEAWVREASTSMAPFLRPGDRLLLRPAAGPLRRGAVVAYPQRGRVLVHRVVGTDGRGILVKGDGAEAAERVRAADVLGRVVAVRRPSGRTIRLDRFPWPALGRLLAFVSLGTAGAGPVGRRALRLAFRIVGAFVR